MTEEQINFRISFDDIIVIIMETRLVKLRSFDCKNVKCAINQAKYITKTVDLIRSVTMLVGEQIGKK